MRDDALAIDRSTEVEFRREAIGERYSECHRLTMKDGSQSGFRLDRMPKAVAKIEQRAAAQSVFYVACNNPRL